MTNFYMAGIEENKFSKDKEFLIYNPEDYEIETHSIFSDTKIIKIYE